MATPTFAAAPRLAGSASSLWVPSVLKNRHIFTRDQFRFINMFGSPDVQGDDQGMSNTTVKSAGGGLIRSEVDYSMNPKSYDFTKLPTNFTATTTVAAGTAGSTSALVLDQVKGLKKYDLLKNRATKAVLVVNSVSSLTATCYPVSGGLAGDGVDGWTAGDVFDKNGSAYPDGATVGNGFRQDAASNSNWMQFHVNEISKGILADKLKLFPMQDNAFESDRMTAQINHNQARELACLFGVAPAAGSITAGGDQIYLMNGLEGLSTLSLDVGGTVTWDELKLVIMPYIQQAGGGDVHMMHGNTIASSIYGFTEEKLVTSMDEKVFGVETNALKTPMGKMVLHPSQPFQQQEGRAVCFKPENIVRRFLPNLDTVYMKGLANNSVLQDTEAYLTCETLLPQNVDSIIWLTNWLN
jgi:hypothetical protein